MGNAYFFNEGYSTHSFIGLYLLARYIRIYKPRFSQLPKRIDILTYIGISLIVTTLIVSLPIIGEGWGNSARVAEAIYNRHHYLFDYLAPTVIISSVALLLFFSKLNIQSKLINWSAASSFSAYLTHANPNITPYYTTAVLYFYATYSLPVAILYTGLMILGIYLASTLIDQIRIVAWNYISRRV